MHDVVAGAALRGIGARQLESYRMSRGPAAGTVGCGGNRGDPSTMLGRYVANKGVAVQALPSGQAAAGVGSH